MTTGVTTFPIDIRNGNGLATLFNTISPADIEADILTMSRNNSILVLSCPFKVSKYISECWQR